MLESILYSISTLLYSVGNVNILVLFQTLPLNVAYLVMDINAKEKTLDLKLTFLEAENPTKFTKFLQLRILYIFLLIKYDFCITSSSSSALCRWQ